MSGIFRVKIVLFKLSQHQSMDERGWTWDSKCWGGPQSIVFKGGIAAKMRSLSVWTRDKAKVRHVVRWESHRTTWRIGEFPIAMLPEGIGNEGKTRETSDGKMGGPMGKEAQNNINCEDVWFTRPSIASGLVIGSSPDKKPLNPILS